MLPGGSPHGRPPGPRPPLIRARTNLQEEIAGPAEANLSLDNMYRRMQVIREDSSLPLRERNRLLDQLARRFVLVFNTRDDTRDYATLKREVKFLAALSRYSFLHMAKRLIVIRDNRLYTRDGYRAFKDFIENEIPLSRSTVYNYIDIVTFFGVQPVGQTVRFEYSKLLPLLPILKASDDRIPKEQIKRRFVEAAETKSKSELAREARWYKQKYGLVEDRGMRLRAVLRYLQQHVPPNPNPEQKRIIRQMIEYLQRIVS